MDYIKSYNNSDSIISNIPHNTQFLLLGESTHGTKQFYEIRSNITKQLIQYNDFNIILFETDWLNLYNVNQYINSNNISEDTNISDILNIKKFPIWMWKNNIIIELIKWIKNYNMLYSKKTYILGIDCYLLIESLKHIISILEIIDIHLSNTLKKDLHFIFEYTNTQSFMNDIIIGKLKHYDAYCENYFQQLLSIIQNKFDLYHKTSHTHNIDYITLISLEQSCEVLINSYEYFKKQFLEPPGSNASWNTRDQHMITTLMRLNTKFTDSKFIIWAHNSHIGDSTATSNGGLDFSQNDTWNLGQMSRAMFPNVYIIGFGTYLGTVTAASQWGVKEQEYILNKPIEDSIEDIIYKLTTHKNLKNSIINLNDCKDIVPFNQKEKQRMIGVIYNPDSELNSHYITSTLVLHYDLYVFIINTNSLKNLC